MTASRTWRTRPTCLMRRARASTRFAAGDPYLTLHDLAGLSLPVDLVTLSGCGTGLNTVADGDELRGLTRGLLAAGARSLLVTLWDVHDRSTAEFMRFFYRGLEAGLSKAA